MSGVTGPAGSPDTYTHGHHPSVLRSHETRTADNSAAYLLDRLRPGMRLLDVGCGPGSITRDLAALVAPGQVVGIDSTSAPLDAARAGGTGDNLRFEIGDVYDLEYADGSFDVVHAHQVLQHLTDPVAALREMRRVCASGGVVAARDADYGAMTWYPASTGLSDWQALYQAVARGNHAEPDAGRHLLSWAQAAGFTDITASASVWCYSDAASRQTWGHTWAERVTESALATQARDRALATRAELQAIARAWQRWSEQPDGWFAVLHGEILCSVP